MDQRRLEVSKYWCGHTEMWNWFTLWHPCLSLSRYCEVSSRWPAIRHLLMGRIVWGNFHGKANASLIMKDYSRQSRGRMGWNVPPSFRPVLDFSNNQLQASNHLWNWYTTCAQIWSSVPKHHLLLQVAYLVWEGAWSMDVSQAMFQEEWSHGWEGKNLEKWKIHSFEVCF